MSIRSNITPKTREQPTPTLAMHPKKFALWLFIVSIIMLFAGLTSAYIVRRAEGNWLEFELPRIFYYSTAVIIISSLTMHWAYVSAKKDELGKLKAGLWLTFLLGVVFLVLQWLGWVELVEMGVFFAGSQSNPAGSFLYVLSGLHGLHLIGGIIFLLIILAAAIRLEIHSKAMVRLEMCATYWHFMDILWVYLFVFLLVNGI
ncbi:MAG: cytochrome c oxidase subunit 3 [Cytophagales bacterium]|nr:cytochrome c oxidase subunit 3 [Bernardetiaceae bacterium]MDW8211072.1 cytochrome c oxidase subunit 3 [Cytophagales bacterium]